MILASGVALAACSPTGTSDDAPWQSDLTFEEQANSYLEQARAGNASEAQIAILEQALAEGELTYEATRVAALTTVECFRESGLDAEYRDYQRASGLVQPGYIVEAPENADGVPLDTQDLCGEAEFYYVTRLYQLQPVARDMTGEFVMSLEQPLRDCLERNGIASDADATGWELAMIALDVQIETEFRVDCLAEVGIDSL